MKKITCLLSACFFIINSVSASKENPLKELFLSKITPVGEFQQEFDSLHLTINKFSIYELDIKAFNALLSKEQSTSVVKLNFPDKPQWEWFLEAYDIRSKKYKLREGRANGVVEHLRTPSYTYKGYANGTVEDMIRMCIKDDYLAGYIKGGEDLFFIEPVRNHMEAAPANHYVVYNIKNINEEVGACGLHEKGMLYMMNEAEKYSPVNDKTLLPDSSCVLTEIAIATTHHVINLWDGDVTSVQDHVIEILNLAAGFFYQAPLNINYTIVEIYVSNTQYEIIPQGTPANSSKLSAFRIWALSDTGFVNTYDVATCWATESFGARGWGYLNAVCSSFKFNLCKYTKGTSPITPYTIQGHELGHNWSANHTNNLMTGSVNLNATGFSEENKLEILNYKGSISCVDEVMFCGAPPPISDFMANQDTICIGDSISFTNLSSADTGVYYWRFWGGEPSKSYLKTPPTVRYTSPGTYSVQLKVSSPTGTTVEKKQGYITVSEDCNITSPEITTLEVDFVCNQDSITLDAGMGYNTYLWSNGDTSRMVTVPFGIYTVTILNANLLTETSDTFEVVQYNCFDEDIEVAAWQMNEEEGDIMNDSTQFNHHGNIVDGTWDYDDCRMSLAFDGVDDYVEVPDFFYGKDFSLHIWMKMNTPITSSNSRYMYCHGKVGTLNSIAVIFKEGSNEITTKVLDFNDSNSSLNFTDSTLVDGNWHLYTLTVEEGVGSKIYFDGVERKKTSGGSDTVDPSGNIFIGAREDLHSSRFYKGLLDDISLYNYAFDSTQVIDFYQLQNEICDLTTYVDTQTTCDTYTWVDDVNYTASTDSATYTLTNQEGLDSLVRLDLTVNYSNEGIDTQTACDSYTWINGNTYTENNNSAIHTLTNVAGCDSTVTLDLTVNPNSFVVDTQITCDDYTWIDGNVYTESNYSAMFILTNAIGCDSIITLDLTINNPEVSVLVESPVITANTTDADAYQWMNCDNNEIIIGETNQSFTATADGAYAVIISMNGCVDTSACSTITIVGLNEATIVPAIRLYPNPTNQYVIIELENVPNADIIITDITGKEVYALNDTNNDKIEITLTDFISGVYFVQIKNAEQKYVFKLIKI